jgi:hypothetical protein
LLQLLLSISFKHEKHYFYSSLVLQTWSMLCKDDGKNNISMYDFVLQNALMAHSVGKGKKLFNWLKEENIYLIRIAHISWEEFDHKNETLNNPKVHTHISQAIYVITIYLALYCCACLIVCSCVNLDTNNINQYKIVAQARIHIFLFCVA